MQKGLVLVADDDEAVRGSTARLLRRAGYDALCFENGDEFLAAALHDPIACVLLDIRMPGTDGLAVLGALRTRGWAAPVIVITGHGDIPLAVEAMRLGAFDFLEKPYTPEGVFQSIDRAVASKPEISSAQSVDREAQAALEGLSLRQRQVLAGILSGQPNKIIAHELGLSIRTVEAYRAQLLTRLGVRGTAEAVKFALAAGMDPHEFGTPPRR